MSFLRLCWEAGLSPPKPCRDLNPLASLASGGEAGGHSAALEYVMMAVSVVIALIGIGIAYLFYVKNPALPKLAAERWKRLYKLVFTNIMLMKSMKSFSSTLLRNLAPDSGKGSMSLSSMVRSTAWPISSAYSPES